jgi:hypothetical protein
VNQESAGSSGREIEPDISDLAGVQITMTLEQLLRLVPRFRERLHRTLEGTTTTSAAPVRLTEVNQRVMDCDCPNIEAIVGRQRIAGIMIDGGSGINVISSFLRRLNPTISFLRPYGSTYELGPTFIPFRLAGPFGRPGLLLYLPSRRFPRTPGIHQNVQFPPIPPRDGFLHDNAYGR